MKALTIWQPWASLIIIGAKPYEFRSWRAPRSLIGQRIVIHAAARKPDFQECRRLLRALEQGGGSAAETCLIAEKATPVLLGCAAELPIAVGIGTAIVGEPLPGGRIAAEFGLSRANDSDRDEHANWGWPMLEVEAWPTPVPMRGKQGIWNWPTPADVQL